MAVLWLPLGAQAATNDNKIFVKSECVRGWYVNADEGDLLPEQVDKGFLFDGPSLVHHSTNFTLSTLPTDGVFVADVQAGVAPLFKLETAPPAYSTINKTAAGKWWSSKIAAGDPGGQSNPVNTPGDLVGKWSYVADTKIFSFGVGYANDAGNKAVVSSITFNETTYDLTCCPEPEPTPSATVSPSPSVTATAAATASPTATAVIEATAVAVMLPVTGSGLTPLVLVGIGLVVLGGAMLLLIRRRQDV